MDLLYHLNKGMSRKGKIRESVFTYMGLARDGKAVIKHIFT